MLKPNNFSKRLGIEPDKAMLYISMKTGFIETFNEAVKKGASEAFLRSLYRQTKYDIKECNVVLGLLPQDGLSQLDMSWDK